MVVGEGMLEGKVAIVTGAARGIGKAISLEFARSGADIAAVDLDAETLQETAAGVRGLDRRCLTIVADVTREAEVGEAVRRTVSELGRIDILCNNAGVVVSKPVAYLPEMEVPAWLGESGGGPEAALSVEEWRRVLDTNLTGAFLFAREVGPHLMRQRSGKVINISSTSAFKGSPFFSAYCASKAALSTLTRCLASEWAQFGINVNAVAPGTVNTEMTTSTLDNPDRRRLYLDAIPLGRLAEPREIALMALFLASEAADYITGQTFVVDGGQLGRAPGV
jgi:NAD(P)-dependent dehydrogenase (short-subunit alcohol dehydrogenase family)